MDPQKTHQRPPLLEEALHLIGQEGWESFSLEGLAQASGVPLVEVYAVFAQKQDVLKAFRVSVQASIVHAVSPEELQAVSPKERVLELLLLRFEVLGANRAAVCALWRALVWAPQSYCHQVTAVQEDMKSLMDYAGLSTEGVIGSLKLKAISLLYMDTMRRWVQDPTWSTEQLMAYLDKALTWGDTQMQRYN